MSTQGEILRLVGLLSTARVRRFAVAQGLAGPGINNETVANTSLRCAKAHEALVELLNIQEASRTKGWALAKSLQAQVNILKNAVTNIAHSDDNEYGPGADARKALDALAAHKET